MQYFLLIYFNNKPLHVSSKFVAHRQEDQLCPDPANSLSTHSMTITVAVYTQLILLMMKSKPARNM